jgi:6-phosphofructokinase
MKKHRIIVAHGGGPTPVINSSLQGVIETARKSGQVEKIYAGRFGIEGVLADDLIDLTDWPAEEVAKLADTPASAIGSCRYKVQEEDYPHILEVLQKHNITAFFYNGGNDSMDTCNKINKLAHREGLDLQVIGIPKTIDNDLVVTDHCPGCESAARYAGISAAELALDASALPIHVVVMEVMGRNAGWITAASGLASKLTKTPQMVLLPEVPFDEEKFLAEVQKRFAQGKGLLVTVSEGIRRPDGSMLGDTGVKDGFGHTIPGGAAQALTELIIQKTSLSSRAEKPDLLGRTAMPYVSQVDREEAYGVGAKAVELVLDGKSGYMVTLEANRSSDSYSWKTGQADLDQVANLEKKFPAEWILDNYSVAEAFWDYCLPLIGSDLPEFCFMC